MPKKGMRGLCFHSKTSSFAFPSSRASPHLAPTRSFSESEMIMERAIEVAEPMIMKWNPDTSTYVAVTSLFYEEKQEAIQFVKCVNDLQQAMHSLVSENSTSEMLVHGQGLMQVAMKRLQKELYQILSLNRAQLDPESVSTRSSRTSSTARSSTSDDYDDEGYDHDRDACSARVSILEVEEVSSIAMSDLRSIVECMISSGYAKECMGIYKIIRKSIIDEGIYRLGVEKITPSQVQKLQWEAMEVKIKSWLDAMKVSMRILFYGERIICDYVFATSDSIRESCFGDITKEGAAILFGFPEAVARSSKKSPEKMFRLLDMYTAISENWPEIESIFAVDSTSAVRSLALDSLIRIGESVRASLAHFESTIQKDSSKSVVPGGGVHPLTIDTMNHLCLLSDYSNILCDIFMDEQPKSPARPPLPESYFESPARDDTSVPAISIRVAWLVLVLLCKLDGKAKNYKDVSFAYLFLANNHQHVISRVRNSNLQSLLGEEWIAKQEDKVRQFAANYERIGWGDVFDLLLDDKKSPAATSPEQTFIRFNSIFEKTYQRQSPSVVPDQDLRERIKKSIEQKIVPAYRALYDTHRAEFETKRALRSIVKHDPEGITRCLSKLFLVSSDRNSLSRSSLLLPPSSSSQRGLLSR